MVALHHLATFSVSTDLCEPLTSSSTSTFTFSAAKNITQCFCVVVQPFQPCIFVLQIKSTHLAMLISCALSRNAPTLMRHMLHILVNIRWLAVVVHKLMFIYHPWSSHWMSLWAVVPLCQVIHCICAVVFTPSLRWDISLTYWAAIPGLCQTPRRPAEVHEETSCISQDKHTNQFQIILITFVMSHPLKKIYPYAIGNPLSCQLHYYVELFVEFAPKHCKCQVFSWIGRNT